MRSSVSGQLGASVGLACRGDELGHDEDSDHPPKDSAHHEADHENRAASLDTQPGK